MIRRILAAAALAAAVGCSDQPSAPTEKAPAHPVRGTVRYDGKPAAGVQVTFSPSAGVIPNGPSRPPAGVTGADGTFTLTSYQDGDGAPEGQYQVVLYWPGEESEGGERGSDRLLGWYDVKHSELSAVVKAGDNTLPPFEVPEVKLPPAAMSGVPGRN